MENKPSVGITIFALAVIAVGIALIFFPLRQIQQDNQFRQDGNHVYATVTHVSRVFSAGHARYTVYATIPTEGGDRTNVRIIDSSTVVNNIRIDDQIAIVYDPNSTHFVLADQHLDEDYAFRFVLIVIGIILILFSVGFYIHTYFPRR